MAAWLKIRFHLTAKCVEHQKFATKSSKSPRFTGASLRGMAALVALDADTFLRLAWSCMAPRMVRVNPPALSQDASPAAQHSGQRVRALQETVPLTGTAPRPRLRAIRGRAPSRPQRSRSPLCPAWQPAAPATPAATRVCGRTWDESRRSGKLPDCQNSRA